MKTQLQFADYVSRPGEDFYMADLALEPGEHILPHCHNYYEFFVVLHGEFEEECAGVRTRLIPAQAHILAPSDFHCLYSASRSSQSVLRNIAVGCGRFERCLVESGLSPMGLHRYFFLNSDALSVYQFKTEAAYRLYQDQQTFDFLMKSLLGDMLITSLTCTGNGEPPRWLTELRREMEQEESYVSGLPRMLEIAGKSQEYLTRAFRRYYGETPTEYINRLRLRQAAWLLQTTPDRVIDILYRCGFNNVSYFNRLFKAHYQQTPQEYRNRKNFFF